MRPSESRLKLNLWIAPVTITTTFPCIKHDVGMGMRCFCVPEWMSAYCSARTPCTTQCRSLSVSPNEKWNKMKTKWNGKNTFDWLTWVLFVKQIFPLELSAFVCRTLNGMEIFCRTLPSTLSSLSARAREWVCVWRLFFFCPFIVVCCLLRIAPPHPGGERWDRQPRQWEEERKKRKKNKRR